MAITWTDAVREGLQLIETIENNQMRLWQIADELDPIYGDSTLARYAQAIGTNLNTLQNYRSVYRVWNEDLRRIDVPKFSVAKALVRHPDRAKIIADNPYITEKQAKEETKRYKETRATYERYTNQAMHKLTRRIVTNCNSFLKKDGRLSEMLSDVTILNRAELEYIQRIVDALERVNLRVNAALDDLGVKIDSAAEAAKS